MQQNYFISPESQKVEPLKKKRKGSKMFTFDYYMSDIVVEAGTAYKLSSGVVRVHGWTKNVSDIDVDTTLFELKGKWECIKKYLEFFGGMEEIDQAAKDYVRSVIWKKRIYPNRLQRIWAAILKYFTHDQYKPNMQVVR